MSSTGCSFGFFSRWDKWLPLAGLLLAMVTPYAFAQETTAAIQGTVKDSSGGVIAKATWRFPAPRLSDQEDGDRLEGVTTVFEPPAGNLRAYSYGHRVPQRSNRTTSSWKLDTFRHSTS